MTGIARSLPLQRNTLLPTVLLVFSCFCFGTIPYFAKSLTDAGIVPYAVAFYRYGLSAVILMPLLLVPAALIKTVLWGVFSGIAVGLGWIGYVSALKTVPVSTVGVLYMTYPVFTLVIGWIWFRDMPSRRAILGSLLVLIAALLAVSPAAIEAHQLPTLIISLSAPISFGFGINVLIHKLKPLKPLTRVATFTMGSSLGLLPLVLISDTAVVLPQDPADWKLVAGLALGTALIPQLIYSTCAPQIGAARSAVAGSVELPTMFMISWFVLGEVIGPVQWLACLLVTIAIVMTPARTTRNLSTQMAVPAKARSKGVPPRLSDIWFDD